MSDRPLSERVRSEFEPVCDCARWIRCRWCTLADEIAELEAAGLVVAEDNTRLMAEARSLEAESDRPLSERVREWDAINLETILAWADEIAALEAENKRLRAYVISSPCRCVTTPIDVWCRRCAALEEGGDE